MWLHKFLITILESLRYSVFSWSAQLKLQDSRNQQFISVLVPGKFGLRSDRSYLHPN